MRRRYRRPARRGLYRRYEAVSTPIGRARPAAPRRNFQQAAALHLDRPRQVSLGLLVALIAAALWVGFADAFYVNRIKLTGASRVPEQEIIMASGLAGMHIVWANARETERRLVQTLPALRAARVACRLPADCTIDVIERAPVWVWRWGQASLWVDADGVAFPAHGTVPGLPVLESTDALPLQPGQSADPRLHAAITAAAQAFPDVAAWRYTAAHGLEFSDPNGYPVYLGDGPDMAGRAVVWRALRASLAARDITPKYVDLRFLLTPVFEQ